VNNPNEFQLFLTICFLGEASKNKATEETEGKTEETPSSTEAPSKPKEEEEVREETV
jgi:hypothetical protein